MLPGVRDCQPKRKLSTGPGNGFRPSPSASRQPMLPSGRHWSEPFPKHVRLTSGGVMTGRAVLCRTCWINCSRATRRLAATRSCSLGRPSAIARQWPTRRLAATNTVEHLSWPQGQIETIWHAQFYTEVARSNRTRPCHRSNFHGPLRESNRESGRSQQGPSGCLSRRESIATRASW